MSKPRKDLEEIKESLDNAEEALRGLTDETKATSAKSYKKNTPAQESTNDNNLTDNGMWTGISVLIFLLLAVAFSNNFKPNEINSARPNTQRPLTFASSCGSPATQDYKKWWPVLGAADLDLLHEVKTKYCGDAYITENNALQVASFDSREAAYEFAKKIEQVTNQRFRVGQGK